MIYRHLIYPVLSRFQSFRKIGLRILSLLMKLPLMGRFFRLVYCRKYPGMERELFGLAFPGPIALTEGHDVSGEFYNDLANLGFAYVDIGPFGSPDPDETNLRKAIENIKRRPPKVKIAASLQGECRKAFSLLYDFVDFFSVTMVSDDIGDIQQILDEMLEMRLCYDAYKPIVLKILPHTDEEMLKIAVDYCRMSGIDAIEGPAEAIPFISEYTERRVTVIASGGQLPKETAAELIRQGAAIVEIDTEFSENGPSTVKGYMKYISRSNNTQ